MRRQFVFITSFIALLVGVSQASEPLKISESEFIEATISQQSKARLPVTAGINATPMANPSFDPSDIWYDPNESGWGVSMNFRPSTTGADGKMFVVWYTYDPRRSAGSGISEPLWVVVPAVAFQTATRFEGDMYVTKGTFFGAPWNGITASQPIGKLTLTFNSANEASFEARMAPQAVSASAPEAGLPAYIVRKTIRRLDF